MSGCWTSCLTRSWRKDDACRCPLPRKGNKGMPTTVLACKCFRKSVCFSKKTRYICRSRRKQSPCLMQHSETHCKRTRSDIDFQRITSTLKTRLVWSEKKASSECKEALFEGQRSLVCKAGDWCMPHTPPTGGGKTSAAAEGNRLSQRKSTPTSEPPEVQ